MGTLMRRSAAIAQCLPAAFINPLEPLVAGLSADVVPRAQLRHRVQVQLPIADESLTLFHGCRLQPGHRPTSVGPQRNGVTHVPGLMCYLCTRFVPVRGLTRLAADGARCNHEAPRLKLGRWGA